MIGDRDTATSSASAHRAVIDIGSNTVRMVVYGGASRAPIVLINEKVTARLGASLTRTGKMAPAAMEAALAALKRYARILGDLKVPQVHVMATAAVREASNGPKFLKAVRKIGLEPRLLSGEEEARTSAMGVIGAFPGARGLVIDLGGASMELIRIDKGRCMEGVTLPIGALMLAEMRAGGGPKFRRRIDKLIKGSGLKLEPGETCYMVGGTWRALAGYAMHERGHPLSDPHGFVLSGAEADSLARSVRQTAPKKLNVPRISAQRAEVLPDAAALLNLLLARIKPSRLVFSSWGLREGCLFGQLDPAARAQDPLLAGVAEFCAPRGGQPTLSAQIAAWTVDALPASGKGRERVRLAATMLALASMQIEPNFRLKQAMNWALHKRWLDLGDTDRAMVAATLAANCGTTALPRTLSRLATPEELEEGLIWGFGIRLARRMGGGSRRSLRNSCLRARKGHLVLSLGESHSDLMDANLMQDLANLAARIGRKPVVEIVPNGTLIVPGLPEYETGE